MTCRREFLTAGIAAAAAGLRVEADDQNSPTGAPGREPLEKQPPEELLLALVRQSYPSEKLTPEVLESIRAELRGVWARSQRLSRFPLRNGDEPAIRFRA